MLDGHRFVKYSGSLVTGQKCRLTVARRYTAIPASLDLLMHRFSSLAEGLDFPFGITWITLDDGEVNGTANATLHCILGKDVSEVSATPVYNRLKANS